MRDVPHRPKLTTHLRPDAELRIPSLRLVSVDETVTQNLGLLADPAGSWKGRLSGVDHVRLAAPDDMARPTHCNRSRRRLGRAADLSPIQTVSGITAAIKFV
jgi:hypothetical protein